MMPLISLSLSLILRHDAITPIFIRFRHAIVDATLMLLSIRHYLILRCAIIADISLPPLIIFAAIIFRHVAFAIDFRHAMPMPFFLMLPFLFIFAIIADFSPLFYFRHYCGCAIDISPMIIFAIFRRRCYAILLTIIIDYADFDIFVCRRR
jgi:hypothetical protein